jgi:hypothetical protein
VRSRSERRVVRKPVVARGGARSCA